MATSTKSRPVGRKSEPNPSATLEHRIAVLEREVARLKGEKYANEKPYLKTAGVLADSKIAQEAERLGRAWRKRQNKRPA
jgi:hypothetical protein